MVLEIAALASHAIRTQLTELKPRPEAAPIVRDAGIKETNPPGVNLNAPISPNQFRTILLAQAFPSSVTNNAQRSEYLGVPLFLKNNAKHCNPHENEAVANELRYIASTYVEGNTNFNTNNHGFKIAAFHAYQNPHTHACHVQALRTKIKPNSTSATSPTTYLPTGERPNHRVIDANCTIEFSTPVKGKVTLTCEQERTPVIPTNH